MKVRIKRKYEILPQGDVVEEAGGLRYLRAEEPDYKAIIDSPMFRRRMGRVVKMGVAAALECLGDTPSEKIGGIITSTRLGCIVDMRKFMDCVIDTDPELVNPTPFISSTFNTVGGQIALLRGIRSYNATYVNRLGSCDSAVEDAWMLLEEGAEYVLLGAFEECTAESLLLEHRLYGEDYVSGEGAAFVLLQRSEDEGFESMAPIVEYFRSLPFWGRR